MEDFNLEKFLLGEYPPADNLFWLEFCVLLFPFLSFMFILVYSNLKERDELLTPGFFTWTATCSVGASMFFSIYCAIRNLNTGQINEYNLANWFEINDLNVEILLLFDPITYVMLVIVTSISFVVHLYSIDYMSDDPRIVVFMSYLNLFTFFMLVLVASGNFMLMFLGWEGVGLSSYLLINFWQTRVNANKAAVKAVIVNKIGDVLIMLSIALIFFQFKTFDYFTIFSLIKDTNFNQILFFSNLNVLDLICLTLFGGAMAKSAQLGLHTWLPDAMEGPSPVSALIHAATMVTAGVFIIVRCSPLFEYSEFTLWIITITGTLTLFFAAVAALTQNDIKRIIAYSTCSQLGYMIMVCGLSGYDYAMYHLSNHAFFKALLFLSAGSVIHAMSDEQDIRKFGGLVNLLPLSYVCILFGSLSLMGFPFFSGFYSKDGILEIAYASGSNVGLFAYIMGSLSAFLTSFYSIRLIILAFLTKPNGFIQSLLNAHDAPKFMASSMILLFIPTITIGWLTFDIFIGMGSSFWDDAIYIRSEHCRGDSEFVPLRIKLIPIVLSLLGALLSFVIFYLNTFNIASWHSPKLYLFSNYKWFFDPIYNFFIVKSLLYFSNDVAFETLDRGVFEWIGPHGLTYIVKRLVYFTKTIHQGIIYYYLILSLVGILMFPLAKELQFLSQEDFQLIIFLFSFYPFVRLTFNDLDENSAKFSSKKKTLAVRNINKSKQ